MDETSLVITTGMHGATVNIYAGLTEFEDMSFALHLLTAEDLFYDVGANVGVYSVLASGVRGAKSVAIEPMPNAIAALKRNIAINQLGALVDILEIGVAAERGEHEFSTDEDTTNHVVLDGSGLRVPVMPLDEIFAVHAPTLLKIDVEGFETNVIKGAPVLLTNPGLKAIIIELNGSGKRYGFNDRDIDAAIRGFGFGSFVYDPRCRNLQSIDDSTYSGNTIYARDLTFVEHRLRTAKPFRVLRHQI